ncbi:serine/arginine-rich splicing factor 4-like [Frankliniella occidentalis]|uniref:Serine/arginine-rich splicing factor 4-like n=1 Tax=Frankliniella occidentalis TaxID=133901 RepID=A0A6J1TIJ5_FRAOC|nr:serine/arginine-rich splicing factor 4-like [Frankliniella occidentalis]
MSKYSTESDSSDGHSRKKGKSSRRGRSPSSSSSESGSRHRRRTHKSGHSRRRSHSSDVSHKSSRRDRDRSSDRSHEKSKSRYSRRSRSSSRSRRRRSRSRSQSKSHSRRRSSSHSPSRSYKKTHSRRSRSRSKGHSRRRSSSGSSAESKEQTLKGRQPDVVNLPVRSQGSPSSRSQPTQEAPSASQSAPEEALTERLQKAIWAAKTADQQLRNQGLIGARKEVDPTFMVLEAINRSNLLDEINSDGFSPRQFTSGAKRDEYPIVVDLASQPAVPPPAQVKQDPKAIFHSSLLVDEPQRLERWIKKLYSIRQRAINGEPFTFS